MKTTTLCYLLRDGEVLLGMKKEGPQGFGVGKWNGIGGKVEEDESIEEAAIRETKEEIGVDIDAADLISMGSISFVYEDIPDWDQVVNVFITTRWSSQPVESREMRPQWFPIDKLPFASMWSDDEHWLPLVLQGKTIWGEFVLDQKGTVVKRFTVDEA